jgi:hypothetical protein
LLNHPACKEIKEKNSTAIEALKKKYNHKTLLRMANTKGFELKPQQISTILSFVFEISKLIVEGLVKARVNPAKKISVILTILIGSTIGILAIGQYYGWWDAAYFLYKNCTKKKLVGLIVALIGIFVGFSGDSEDDSKNKSKKK